jgi:hypothetical protein
LLKSCEKSLKIGEYYVPIMGIMDFPNRTYPAIFDQLNRTMTEFRWTTRFLPLSKELSSKEAEKYQSDLENASPEILGEYVETLGRITKRIIEIAY